MQKNSKIKSLFSVFTVMTAITLVPFVVSDVFAQTDTITTSEIHKIPDLKFDGKTSGWAIVGNPAHNAGLNLDGKAIYNDNGIWIVKSDSELFIGERDAKLDLKGKVVDNKLRLNGTGELSDGTEFRIILSGHYAPIANSDGGYAVAFTTAIVSTTGDNSIRIPLALVGQVNIEVISIAESDRIIQDTIQSP